MASTNGTEDYQRLPFEMSLSILTWVQT